MSLLYSRACTIYFSFISKELYHSFSYYRGFTSSSISSNNCSISTIIHITTTFIKSIFHNSFINITSMCYTDPNTIFL
nr:MAG TPA: hypothetical protein [Bacteriophage sp.]